MTSTSCARSRRSLATLSRLTFSSTTARSAVRNGGQFALHHDRPPRSACLLALSTHGGSADAAYRLARALRRRYTHLTVFVDDYCKGAGMLLALAAHELVISDFGELGPLDLASQYAFSAGQVATDAALARSPNALHIDGQVSPQHVTVRLLSLADAASEGATDCPLASSFAVGLLAPVLSRRDPEQLAEVDRAIRTARLYAERLGSEHLKEHGLERLLTVYPSHDFVLDREEAAELLHTVRAPTELEAAFLTQVEPIMSSRRMQGRLLLLEDALSLVDDSLRRAGDPGRDVL